MTCWIVFLEERDMEYIMYFHVIREEDFVRHLIFWVSLWCEGGDREWTDEFVHKFFRSSLWHPHVEVLVADENEVSCHVSDWATFSVSIGLVTVACLLEATLSVSQTCNHFVGKGVGPGHVTMARCKREVRVCCSMQATRRKQRK